MNRAHRSFVGRCEWWRGRRLAALIAAVCIGAAAAVAQTAAPPATPGPAALPDGDAPVRQKPVYDGAIPSGNSVAMQALFALARMTANLELEETADRMKFTFAGTVRKSPAGHTHFLTGLEFMLGPNFEVVVTGMPGAEDTTAMVRAIRSRYTPDSLVIFRPSGRRDRRSWRSPDSPGIL